MPSNQTPFVDLNNLSAWIGREEVSFDIISIDLVRKFNATFDLSGSMPAEGDVAPLLVNYCLAQPAALSNALGEDGHPQKGGFLPPVPLPRRMWAGSSLTFNGDLHVGDKMRRVSRIADVAVKEGRSGRLCFVTVEHVVRVGDMSIVEERQNIVYRAAADGAESISSLDVARSVAAPTHSRQIVLSEPVLFRYSALTFNGHRIHYDRRYAMEVEHYPGLVKLQRLIVTIMMCVNSLNTADFAGLPIVQRSALFAPPNGHRILSGSRDANLPASLAGLTLFHMLALMILVRYSGG